MSKMNFYGACKVIRDTGLLLEKMTEEEKKAKRKARRDAKKAEEKAWKDQHIFIEMNKNGGGMDGFYREIRNLVRDSGIVPQFSLLMDSEHPTWEDGEFEWQVDGHKLGIVFDTKAIYKSGALRCKIQIDGEDQNHTYQWTDPEAYIPMLSNRSMNIEWQNSFDYTITIQKESFLKFIKSVYDTLVGKYESMKKREEELSGSGIPSSFESVVFSFTEQPVDPFEPRTFSVPREEIMEWFHRDKGEDNNSGKDFKDFLDSLQIEFVRNYEEPASLMHNSFYVSQYWFNKCNRSAFGHVDFRGYGHDDVRVTGWKLV